MEPSSHVLTATTVGNVISPKRDQFLLGPSGGRTQEVNGREGV